MERLLFSINLGSRAGSNEGKLLYRAWVNCDDSGAPFLCEIRGCQTAVTYDCFKCNHHLETEGGVYVAPSSLGFGLGLFTSRAFRANERVAHLGGELLSSEELDVRYAGGTDEHNKQVVVTAPYAVVISNESESGNVLDCARIRGAGSYANCPRGTLRRPNACIEEFYIVARKYIPAHCEVLVSYGRSYWSHSDASYATHRTELTSTPTLPTLVRARYDEDDG